MIYPVKSGIGWVISKNSQKKECFRLEKNILTYRKFTKYCKSKTLPSLGIVRIGICVMEPFLPSTRPARYDLIKNEQININIWVLNQPPGDQFGKITQIWTQHLLHVILKAQTRLYLINCRQISVHVSWKTTTTRNLFTSCRHLYSENVWMYLHIFILTV